MSVGQIFSIVNAHLAEAAGESASAASSIGTGFDYNPATITLPHVSFVTDYSGEVPETPEYSVTPPPTAELSITPDAALYAAASTVVGSFSAPTLSSVDYEAAVGAPQRPDASAGLPDLNYPQAGYVTVDDSAGLGDIPAPNVVIGVRPDFAEVQEVDYDLPDIEMMAYTVPPVTNIPEADLLDYPEQLQTVAWDNLKDSITDDLTGCQFITDYIQNLMYDLKVELVEKQRLEGERAVFTQAASNGATNTTGPLVDALADLNLNAELQQEKVYEENREFIYNVAKNRVLTALRESLALEQANLKVHVSYASKLLDVFRYNVGLHVELFNAVSQIHNAQIKAVGVVVSAYNDYVRGITDSAETYNTAEMAKTAVLDTNQAKLTAYDAQAKTLKVQADEYATTVKLEELPIEEFTIYVRGLQANLAIARENLNAYRASIEAYGDSIGQQQAKIRGYESEVRAESSAAQVSEANWRAYTQQWQAAGQANSAVEAFNRATTTALRNEINVMSSALEKQRSYLRAMQSWLSANTSIAQGHNAGIDALVGYTTRHNQAVVELENARSAVSLAVEDAAATQSALDAQVDAAQALIDAGLLSSEATTYAGLAQSAYNVRNVSANVRATSSAQDTYGYSSRVTEGQSLTRSYSYRKTFSEPT